MIAIVFGGMKYRDDSLKMIEELKVRLAGKTFTAHSEHVEGLAFLMNEYGQLTFIDESTLEYAYIETKEPKKKDDIPEYKGTYSYTVSRTITGKYKISTNGGVYKLRINDNNGI